MDGWRGASDGQGAKSGMKDDVGGGSMKFRQEGISVVATCAIVSSGRVCLGFAAISHLAGGSSFLPTFSSSPTLAKSLFSFRCSANPASVK